MRQEGERKENLETTRPHITAKRTKPRRPRTVPALGTVTSRGMTRSRLTTAESSVSSRDQHTISSPNALATCCDATGQVVTLPFRRTLSVLDRVPPPPHSALCFVNRTSFLHRHQPSCCCVCPLAAVTATKDSQLKREATAPLLRHDKADIPSAGGERVPFCLHGGA